MSQTDKQNDTGNSTSQDSKDASARQDLNRDVTTWKESPLLVLKGFLMGSADIVPGVSGGTMALIVGIYNRLLHAIKSFDSSFIGSLARLRIKTVFNRVHWKFLFPLVIGIGLAIIFFTRVVPLQVYMFSHPELVFGIFFGLIVGSIVILAKEIEGWTFTRVLFLLMGAFIGFWVVNLVPTQTSEAPFYVFLSGSVAIIAMILPGISGSYILLILRKYDFILSTIHQLQQPEYAMEAAITLLPFAAGALVGLVVFSRILSWLLDHYYEPTFLVLIGFLIGSLYVIWPFQDREYEKHVQTKILPMTDPRVQELREDPESRNQPEYHRLGNIVNPDAELEHLKNIEYQTVKKKMVDSNPYVPFLRKEQDRKALSPFAFWSGVAGMFGGLLLVLVLDFIRRSGVPDVGRLGGKASTR